MLYIVHCPDDDNKPDLCGEAAKDCILCRFDCSLEEMQIIMRGVPECRMKMFGLPTGKLYLSERGRKVVYVQDFIDSALVLCYSDIQPQGLPIQGNF